MIYLLGVSFVSQKLGLEGTGQIIRLKWQPYAFSWLALGGKTMCMTAVAEPSWKYDGHLSMAKRTHWNAELKSGMAIIDFE